MTEVDISTLAAVLGRLGGRVSKRPPGPLRRILMAICAEIDSTENRKVFDYWQTYDTAALADHAELGSCWFRHSLWVNPRATNDPYHDQTSWDDVVDGDYLYCYFDGEHELATDARTIRQTMNNLKKVNKRLAETDASQTRNTKENYD